MSTVCKIADFQLYLSTTHYVIEGFRGDKEKIKHGSIKDIYIENNLEPKENCNGFIINISYDKLRFSVSTKNDNINNIIEDLLEKLGGYDKLYYLVENLDQGVVFSNDVTSKYFKYDYIFEVNAGSCDINHENVIKFKELFSKIDPEINYLGSDEVLLFNITDNDMTYFINEINIELLDDKYRDISARSLTERKLDAIFDDIYELTGISCRAWYVYHLIK